MKAKNGTCPPQTVLSDFGLGKLDAARADTVSRHLDTCTDCRDRVAGLTGDSFVDRLRNVPRHGSASHKAAAEPGAPAMGSAPVDRGSNAMNADRNLLFGILAFQNNFIDRQALLSAFDRWTTDKAKSLGDILLEAGALEPSQRQLLDALVAEHIRRHGNDAAKSLAAVSSVNALDPLTAQLPSAGASSSCGMRFTILRPHARGGLGRVSVALDGELNREVAFKEIQERYAGDEAIRSRFLLEAEVTGNLEHPGIVPVYGLGQFADGRPFYAMRFVQGDSLHDAIKRFHEADNQEREDGGRTLALRKLLGRFVDVCNAIEYAHSRGVLHRDLKPGNVMLGKYGETLVVDWGLAKASQRRESDVDSHERTLRPSAAASSALTQMGSVIGTPQYMSPEQAEGRLDALTPATDVYSLGGTLYCLLTGRAPFPDSDLATTIAQVCKGSFPPPRSIKRDVPPPLQSICLKAMALRAEDRYPSARTLADDIERWIADEPVSVYREPIRRRFARWRRNHKTFVGATAAALVVLVVGGIATTFIGRRANERTRAMAAARFRPALVRERPGHDDA